MSEFACLNCDAPLVKTWRGGHNPKWCSERCRKVKLYSGTCDTCGGKTNGYDGPGTAATRCRECLNWSRDAILEALREWGEDHGGIPPREIDTRTGGEGHGRLPYESTVKRHFGSWNTALLAANYEALHCDRRPETQQAIEDALRAGESVAAIADRFGVVPQAIYQRLRLRGIRIADLRSAA